MYHYKIKIKKKMGKWILIYCTSSIEQVIVRDMLNLNSLIHHCIQKTILSGDSPSGYIIKYNI